MPISSEGRRGGLGRALTRSDFPRPHWANLVCLLALAATLAGCGTETGTSTSTADAGASRYFGDHPGQEATKAAIDSGDCRALRRAVEAVEGVPVRTESEPSPPSSRCLITARSLNVSVYLDAAYAARQRYANRMVEQVQFYAPDPARIPHSVPGVGDRSAGEHTASWIPSFSTLYAVRGNRWVTVAYSAASTPRPGRKAKAAALARRTFRLTARRAP
jgi:hypothetical protein